MFFKEYNAMVDVNGYAHTKREIFELLQAFKNNQRRTPSESMQRFLEIWRDWFWREIPTREQCLGFLADCRGMLYGDSHKANGGAYTEEFLVALFKGNERVYDLCDGLIYHRLTERQGGGLVI